MPHTALIFVCQHDTHHFLNRFYSIFPPKLGGLNYVSLASQTLVEFYLTSLTVFYSTQMANDMPNIHTAAKKTSQKQSDEYFEAI